MGDLQATMETLRAFRDERGWDRFHSPKDLAIPVSLEAAELLEAFQWSGADTSGEGREGKVREGLADVLVYCPYLADAMGLDPVAIIGERVAANGARYPVEKARGNARKYTEP